MPWPLSAIWNCFRWLSGLKRPSKAPLVPKGSALGQSSSQIRSQSSYRSRTGELKSLRLRKAPRVKLAHQVFLAEMAVQAVMEAQADRVRMALAWQAPPDQQEPPLTQR